MKKSTKIVTLFLVFGIVLLIAGGTVFAATYPYGESPDAILSENCKQTIDRGYTFNTQDLDKIVIATAYQTNVVNAEPGSENENAITVSAVGTIYQFPVRENDFAVTRQDGTLNIEFVPRYAAFSLEGSLVVNVTLPLDYAGAMRVNQTSGKVNMDVTNTFDSFSLKVSSGSFQGDVRSRDQLAVQLTSGSVNGSFVTAAPSASVSVTSGTFSGVVTSKNKISTSLTSGKLELLSGSGFTEATGEIDSYVMSGSCLLNLNRLVSGTVKVTSGSAVVTLPKTVDALLSVTGKISSGRIVCAYGSESGTHRDDFHFTEGVSGAPRLDLALKVESGTMTLNEALAKA